MASPLDVWHYVRDEPHRTFTTLRCLKCSAPLPGFSHFCLGCGTSSLGGSTSLFLYSRSALSRFVAATLRIPAPSVPQPAVGSAAATAPAAGPASDAAAIDAALSATFGGGVLLSGSSDSGSRTGAAGDSGAATGHAGQLLSDTLAQFGLEPVPSATASVAHGGTSTAASALVPPAVPLAAVAAAAPSPESPAEAALAAELPDLSFMLSRTLQQPKLGSVDLLLL